MAALVYDLRYIVIILVLLSICRISDAAFPGGCATANLSLESGSYVFPDHVSRPDTVGIGVVIRACCNQGYVREGPENITCLSTGEFTSEIPTCTDIDECVAPFLPSGDVDENDHVEDSAPSWSSTPAVVDYEAENIPDLQPLLQLHSEQLSCQGGRLLPPNELRCHVDAQCHNTEGSFDCVCRDNFIGNGTACEVDTLPCEELSVPENGNFIYRTDRKLEYGCNNGYSLQGCSELVCRRGRWVGARSRRECRPVACRDFSVKCSELTAPAHGYITASDWREGSRVHFSCDQGYELGGSAQRLCLENGYWSGQTTVCRAPKTLSDIAADIQTGLIDRFALETMSSPESRRLGRSGGQRVGLDLVFAFDRSSSIHAGDFQLALNFTKQVITEFGVSYEKGGTRVAAIAFATTAEIKFRFTEDFNTKEKVFQGLDTLTDDLGGGTALKEGLEKVNSLLPPDQQQDSAENNASAPVGLMRPRSRRVLFIFTDGRHNTADPEILARDLKDNQGVHIFVVAVGPLIDERALKRIASTPSASHFFHIRNFDDLEALTSLISNNKTDHMECGKLGLADNFHEGDPLINNGYHAGEKVWPWLSIIHRDTPTGDSEFLCSGALVCQEWVLTAASCFLSSYDYTIIEGKLHGFSDMGFVPVNVSVTLGEYNTSREEGFEQTILVDEIIIHNRYNASAEAFEHDYDIALLRLGESAKLDISVRTTCLPDENDILRNCFVLGWGTANEGTHVSPVPLQYPMPPVNPSDCSLWYTEQSPGDLGAHFPITERMACFGDSHISGRDPRCNGDRGSPLVCQRGDGETWIVGGVSTYGQGCSSINNRYSVFTMIEPDFTQWIKEQTGNCSAQHLPGEAVDLNS